jgi:predicted nucleic acid-binding protein
VIFVDTSAIYAILDADDRNHGAAVTTLRELRSRDAVLMTHEYVLVEAIALAQRRLGMTATRRLIDDLLPLIQVAWVDPGLHAEARAALLAAGRRAVSLVDWTSFLAMRANGVRQAFTFDPDFAVEGFDVVPAGPPAA